MNGSSATPLRICTFAVVLLLVGTGLCLAQPRLVVNGAPKQGGDTLVAIEGAPIMPNDTLAAALGAQSEYLPNEQKKIVVTLGNTTLNLWVGSTLGTVNGVPTSVDVSPLLVGQTVYVPIRFVVEGFGGTMQWDAANQICAVTLRGQQVPDVGGQTVKGTILQTYTGAATSLLLRDEAEGTTRFVTLSEKCELFTRGANGQLQPLQLDALKAGEDVEVTIVGGEGVRVVLIADTGDQDGGGQTDQFQHMRVGIDGVHGKFLLLAGGQTMLVDEKAEVLDERGKALPLQSLQPGDSVLLILNTRTNQVVRIVREQAANATPTDKTPPVWGELIPAKDSTIVTSPERIRASFIDDDSGINEASSTMIVDKVDVTSQCTQTGAYIDYKPPKPLKIGRHIVSVTVTDRAGNQARKAWAFNIADPNAAQILRAAHNATRPMAPGETLRVEATVVKAGGEMLFDIGDFRQGIRMDRVADTSNYEGTYTVRQGDNTTQKITVRYRPAGGEWTTAEIAEPVVFGTPVAGKVAITAPKAGEVVGEQMIVTGTAPAGSTVTVKVYYIKKRFLDMSHDLTPQTVTTAADGTWTTAAFATKDALFGTPDSLDIQAELIDPATNEAISVEKIQVKGR